MEAFVHGKTHEFPDWLDTDGNVINASDGGIIYAEGKYHWYGQALGDSGFLPDGRGGQTTSVGVVMYASEDLLHWTYEGVILACSSDPASPLYAPMRFERPKIVYNEKTKQYVLWCHYVKHPGNHDYLPGTGEAGVAYCDTVNGSYTWVGTCRPIDDRGIVRDSTLYQDKDGTAYFIYDRHLIEDKKNEQRCLHIVKLTEDYLAPTSEYKRIEVGLLREAPAVVYHDGYYYMLTSGLTGWAPNRAKYLRARDLMGEWEDMGDPCVDDTAGTTYNTQTTYVFRVEGTDTYVHMAERHNTENFLHCSYVWLPIRFGKDHTLSLTYCKEWKL